MKKARRQTPIALVTRLASPLSSVVMRIEGVDSAPATWWLVSKPRCELRLRSWRIRSCWVKEVGPGERMCFCFELLFWLWTLLQSDACWCAVAAHGRGNFGRKLWCWPLRNVFGRVLVRRGVFWNIRSRPACALSFGSAYFCILCSVGNTCWLCERGFCAYSVTWVGFSHDV